MFANMYYSRDLQYLRYIRPDKKSKCRGFLFASQAHPDQDSSLVAKALETTTVVAGCYCSDAQNIFNMFV